MAIGQQLTHYCSNRSTLCAVRLSASTPTQSLGENLKHAIDHRQRLRQRIPPLIRSKEAKNQNNMIR